MDKLMAQFIEEARELINNAGQSLLTLEKTPDDRALIDTLFRDVHTLKGSAGVLELDPMVRVVHVAEELLDLSKEGEMTLDADCIDVLLDTMDLLNGWVDALDASERLPDSAATEAATFSARLEALRGDAEADHDSPPPADDGEGVAWGLFDDVLAPPAAHDQTTGATTSEYPVAPAWLAYVDEPSRIAAWEAANAGKTLWCVEFRPDAGCFFRGDDPLFLARQAPGLLALDAAVAAPEEGLEAMDVFQCQLSFGLVSQADAVAIDEHFQYETDTVTRQELTPEAVIQPAGASIDQPLDDVVLADLKRYWERQQTAALTTSLQVQLELLNPDSREASLLRWLSAVVSVRPDDALVFDTLLAALESPAETLSEQGLIDWSARIAAMSPTRTTTAAEPPAAADDHEAVASATVSTDDSGGQDDADTPELDPSNPEISPVLADQKRLLALCQEQELREGARVSALRVLTNTARAQGARLPQFISHADTANALQQALAEWLTPVAEAAPSGMTSQAAGSKTSEAAAGQSAAADRKPEPSVDRAPSTDTGVKPSPADQAAKSDSPGSTPPVIRSFKVDQEQVENLGDLVGELVVAKNALPFLAHRAEQVFGERQLGREIREQFNVINRITRALQDAMMDVQMLPVSHVFGRFPRLVRDLSRKLDKPIDLVIEGEDTEAEKHVIESLADPLVHLMRNSIDHGIEPRDRRQASGKPETGQVRLSAWQENESVVIEVADDGGGIDPEKTRLKAYEKGLVDERRLKEMNDRESVELVFLPGFSTLDTASDLSGRGVGMDVVRTTIEKAGGRLDVDSEPGKGTRFRMTLPLSMSISQVMQIWIDGQRYGVPMDQVAETVRLPSDRIHRFKDRETVMLRDRVLPVSRSREQLDLAVKADQDTVALLVVRHRGEPVAMVVDDFSEGVEVIMKPMEGSLENLGVYQGTALLGDGSVLLVLNLGVLLSSVRLEEVEHDHSSEG